MGINDESIDTAGIMAAMKVMAANISVNFEKVESNFKVLRAKGDAESEVRGRQLEEILTEQKKTNGRVRAQEKTTEVLRIMSEHKWLTGGFLYGIFNILQLMTIENIISWIKFFI